MTKEPEKSGDFRPGPLSPNKLPESIFWERNRMHQAEGLFCGEYAFGRVSPPKDVRIIRTMDFAVLEFFLESFPNIAWSKRNQKRRVLPMSVIVAGIGNPALADF